MPGKPVDLSHLARYTGGDKALNAEILRLFDGQVSEMVGQLLGVLEQRDAKRWREVTHTIKGAARGVGAFAMGDAAAAAEPVNPATSPDRAIRAEIVFPLREPVRADEVIDHIALTGRNSFCGNCHFGETPAYDRFLGDGALESDVNEPDPAYEVDLEWLRERAAACDETSARCEVLSAVFDHGPVLDSDAFRRRAP